MGVHQPPPPDARHSLKERDALLTSDDDLHVELDLFSIRDALVDDMDLLLADWECYRSMSDDAQVGVDALDTLKSIKIWAHEAGDHAESVGARGAWAG